MAIVAQFFFFCLFGLVMEISVGAASDLVKSISSQFDKITSFNPKTILSAIKNGWSNSKKLKNDVSLLMIPVYGFGLMFFSVISELVIYWLAWHRFILWMLSFSAVEVLSGYLYNKYLHECPWDYSKEPDVIFKYTRIGLLPWWGFCGLILEHYVYIVKSLVC